jgi:hypothetical protein
VTTEDAEHKPQPEALLKIISGFWISRLVYAIAKLGLADLMQDGPKSVEELAEATQTHAPSLFRVLRALASVGVVNNEGNTFSLTPVSELLVTDAKGSFRWFAVSELGEEHFPAWGNLMHSLKTGEIAFNNLYGMSAWEFFRKNPAQAAIFNDSMSGVTAAANEAILAVLDFSVFNKIVDVGGGHGGLITSILKANPKLKGTLFDAPHVISGAREKVAAEGLTDRCEVISGDFFEAVPPGGDAYVLKWIIHDWHNELAIKILKNCRAQLPLNGKLILIDSVVPENDEPDFSKFIDINMMVMTGGKERTETEFRELLEASGLKFLRVIPTGVPTSIIEAEPA